MWLSVIPSCGSRMTVLSRGITLVQKLALTPNPATAFWQTAVLKQDLGGFRQKWKPFGRLGKETKRRKNLYKGPCSSQL